MHETIIKTAIEKNPTITYRELGELLGVSHQRVHQIVKKMGLVKPRKSGYIYCEKCGKKRKTGKSSLCQICRMESERVELTCANCGIVFHMQARLLKHRENKQKEYAENNPESVALEPTCSRQCKTELMWKRVDKPSVLW